MRRAAAVMLLVPLLALAMLAATGPLDHARDLRSDAPQPAPDPAAVRRGEALAAIGHCAGCHTARGGDRYAGGRSIATPFGTVISANLTPDADTGIGRWTREAFRRALAEGRSADGRPLLPACPYPNFSLVEPADADDLFAFLRSLPPRAHRVAAHELAFPYRLDAALVLWRASRFRPATLPPAPPGAAPAWRRGAYLVGGLGHCSACHGGRDRFGVPSHVWDLTGATLPGEGWHAPSLADPAEAGLGGVTPDDAVALLRDGRNAWASMSGPMAMVVAGSLQHVGDDDLHAMGVFLTSLKPDRAAAAPPLRDAPSPALLRQGRDLYDDHCADCHGKSGEGVSDQGPALSGNRALALSSPANVTRMVLGGGFGPSTRAHPRPEGMPPFATRLGDEDIAAVVTHVRWRFGLRAAGVSAFDVNRLR